jgi:hypothetical protein|eukprot:CAMPEP_0174303336 /NCGR_PEP_ID=MMETSP0809-20121228/60130_1 /TAXON_ID=73025 ORGANISM="Eutreptiella gymnastica-like, Strain CCMP1594" /NCGR_SAMPLE_ID=MMETSP0809 /ASSEMBLY_ACC=CAM_ASM_000658 /LENGTH=169 /DNA_ID=CAMNT_0015409351 /DNA_START=19 /DNA_END=528 /DNA_ORIENTATION=-
MGNLLKCLHSDITGPYDLRIKVVSATGIPESMESVKVRVELLGEEQTSTDGQHKKMEKKKYEWSKQPNWLFKGGDFEKDTITVELLGLASKVTPKVAELGLSKGETVRVNLQIDDYNLTLEMKVSEQKADAPQDNDTPKDTPKETPKETPANHADAATPANPEPAAPGN